MELRCDRHYHIPKDLADEYDEKIADADRWLEEQCIARGIKPAVFRFIRREDNEKGKKSDTKG